MTTTPELLLDLIDAGWDVYVRRSPATKARPSGKVLRWGANLPTGERVEHRTGPGLVAALAAWCRENWPAGLEADRPVPEANGYYRAHAVLSRA